MKKKLALLALAVVPLAATATPVPGAQSTVTLSLFAYQTEPVSDTATLYKTKIVKYSYTSRDLLSDLLAEGVLGAGETLNGWKLVVVDRTPLYTGTESDHNTLVFYAIKAGKTPVQIPAARLGLNVESPASADAVVEKFLGDTLTSRSSTFKSLVGLSGRATLSSPDDTYDNSFDLTAFASGGDSVVTRKLKEGTVPESFTYNLLGAVTFKPVLGILTDHLATDNANAPIEGSITFSAFTPIDITAYPYQSVSTE